MQTLDQLIEELQLWRDSTVEGGARVVLQVNNYVSVNICITYHGEPGNQVLVLNNGTPEQA
jgi:hypothetical protein